MASLVLFNCYLKYAVCTFRRFRFLSYNKVFVKIVNQNETHFIQRKSYRVLLRNQEKLDVSLKRRRFGDCDCSRT